MRGIWSRLLLLGVASALSLAAVEVGVRSWLQHWASEEQFLAYASLADLDSGLGGRSLRLFTRHRYLGYALTPGYRRGANAHDALGYRGEGFPRVKPAGEFRIAALGGSTTYTNAVEDWRDAYPHRLEQELRGRGYTNVRVVNAGVPGYMSWESLVNFQFRVLDIDPDLVLVYHAVNDVFPRLVWPPEAYRGDNSGTFGPADEVDTDVRWFERSAAVRVFRIRMGLDASPGALERTYAVPLPTAFGWKYAAQARAGRGGAGFFKKVPPGKMLRANPPRYFRQNIEGIVVLARSRGVEPVLVSFATTGLAKDDPLVSGPFGIGIDQHNAVLAEIAGRRKVPWFDFAKVFPDSPELWFGGLHLNREGAALKARFFADYLAASGLLPAPGAGARGSAPGAGAGQHPGQTPPAAD